MGLSGYELPVTKTNVCEHFWLFHKLSTNTYFLRLEVRRRKYPIIKYGNFLASVNKLSKWEKIGVCTNNGRLGLYGRRKDQKSTVAFNGA